MGESIESAASFHPATICCGAPARPAFLHAVQYHSVSSSGGSRGFCCDFRFVFFLFLAAPPVVLLATVGVNVPSTHEADGCFGQRKPTQAKWNQSLQESHATISPPGLSPRSHTGQRPLHSAEGVMVPGGATAGSNTDVWVALKEGDEVIIPPFSKQQHTEPSHGTMARQATDTQGAFITHTQPAYVRMWRALQ